MDMVHHILTLTQLLYLLFLVMIIILDTQHITCISNRSLEIGAVGIARPSRRHHIRSLLMLILLMEVHHSIPQTSYRMAPGVIFTTKRIR